MYGMDVCKEHSVNIFIGLGRQVRRRLVATSSFKVEKNLPMSSMTKTKQCLTVYHFGIAVSREKISASSKNRLKCVYRLCVCISVQSPFTEGLCKAPIKRRHGKAPRGFMKPLYRGGFTKPSCRPVLPQICTFSLSILSIQGHPYHSYLAN